MKLYCILPTKLFLPFWFTTGLLSLDESSQSVNPFWDQPAFSVQFKIHWRQWKLLLSTLVPSHAQQLQGVGLTGFDQLCWCWASHLAIKHLLEKIRNDYLYTAISALRLLAVQWKKQKYVKIHMPIPDWYTLIFIYFKSPWWLLKTPTGEWQATVISAKLVLTHPSWLWAFWVMPISFTIFPVK